MRLKLILIACFVVVALVPVATLGLWPLNRPIENEEAHVAEKHLLVARHIRGSLVRYQRDLKVAVGLVAAGARAPRGSLARDPLDSRHLAHLRNLHITCVWVLSPARPDGVLTPLAGACPAPASRQAARLAAEIGRSSAFRWGGVLTGPDGQPVFYLARRDGAQIIVAAVGTGLIRQMQRTVFFGRGGHAAIVDRNGRILAHPNAAWVARRQKIAALEPVQAMMAGKTGVTRFWSPAAKKEMIAGYTSVPGAGWGVMVPQPYGELLARAKRVRDQVEIGVVIGILIAIALGLLLSRYMAHPVRAVADAVHRVAGGDAAARVPYGKRWSPTELRDLAAGFNAMASTIQKSKIELEKRVESRTQALSYSEQKLRAALGQAESAVKTKSAFLAQMSHELRTPLNAILGYSEMMEREVLGPVGVPTYREYLGHIHESGTLLRDLIGDILDATKLEDGSMTLSESDVDVAAVLNRACIQAAPMAHKYEIAVCRLHADDLPCVHADETRFLQIVSNLLTNAIKFTEPGGYVMLAAGVRGDGSFVVQVRDSGMGMSETDVDRIAEPFHQAAQNRLHPVEGSGLGITISVALARLHGGGIRYRSAPGVGTLAELSLPADRVGRKAPKPLAAAPPEFDFVPDARRVKLPA